MLKLFLRLIDYLAGRFLFPQSPAKVYSIVSPPFPFWRGVNDPLCSSFRRNEGQTAKSFGATFFRPSLERRPS
jgi:hypothetical protein